MVRFHPGPLMMKSKISLITLGVADFEKSLRFYRDGLGFKTHNYKEKDTIVFFEMEGTWLSLFPKDKLAEDATVSPDGSGFMGITLAHNVKSKEEVEQVFNLAVSAGAKPIKKPQDVFLDGYLWEVAHNPFTDLT